MRAAQILELAERRNSIPTNCEIGQRWQVLDRSQTGRAVGGWVLAVGQALCTSSVCRTHCVAGGAYDAGWRPRAALGRGRALWQPRCLHRSQFRPRGAIGAPALPRRLVRPLRIVAAHRMIAPARRKAVRPGGSHRVS